MHLVTERGKVEYAVKEKLKVEKESSKKISSDGLNILKDLIEEYKAKVDGL